MVVSQCVWVFRVCLLSSNLCCCIQHCTCTGATHRRPRCIQARHLEAALLSRRHRRPLAVRHHHPDVLPHRGEILRAESPDSVPRSRRAGFGVSAAAVLIGEVPGQVIHRLVPPETLAELRAIRHLRAGSNSFGPLLVVSCVGLSFFGFIIRFFYNINYTRLSYSYFKFRWFNSYQ